MPKEKSGFNFNFKLWPQYNNVKVSAASQDSEPQL